MINPAMDAIEFNDKALKFAEEGRNAEARENFEIAIMLNPSFAEAWNNLGTLSYFEGKTDEAREHFERAIKEWPEYDQAHFNLALLLAQAGEKEAATQHSYEAERLGKDVSQIRRLLEAQGQPKL